MKIRTEQQTMIHTRIIVCCSDRAAGQKRPSRFYIIDMANECFKCGCADVGAPLMMHDVMVDRHDCLIRASNSANQKLASLSGSSIHEHLKFAAVTVHDSI